MDMTTFGAFTTARLGIYAAQKALDVTGHNISNINTVGYTRQAVDQISLRVGAVNHYASANGGRAGSGVLITGMSQFRDPYLDIRYRNESASVGAANTKLAGLQELSDILDEVASGDDENGIIEAQFQDLLTQLQNMTKDHATDAEFQGLVRSSAETLTKLFNHYADQLNSVKENREDALKQDVDSVNDILKGIQNLNESIFKSEIYGDSALELRDERNLLIDKLSQYMKIDVTYEPVKIGAGDTIDKLVIKTAKVGGEGQKTLVDGDYVGQLSIGTGDLLNPAHATDPTLPKYIDAAGQPTNDPTLAQKVEYALSMSDLTNAKGDVIAGSHVEFSDTELHGALQADRELLTEAGEFSTKGMAMADPGAATKRGIPYYQNALDALARQFATVMNEANTGYLKDGDGNILNKDDGTILATKNADGTYQFDLDGSGSIETGEAAYSLDDLKGFNTFQNKAKELGGTLFSNSSTGDSTAGITAANISISKSWSTNAVTIQNSFTAAVGTTEVGTSDTENILHIISEIQGSHNYLPGNMVTNAIDGNIAFFKGSFQEMLTGGIQGILAKDVRSTSSHLDTYYANATNLDVSRDSVSGVELNDEAMGLMQYQKSYSAACRLMTTLDQVLDKLINGTGA